MAQKRNITSAGTAALALTLMLTGCSDTSGFSDPIASAETSHSSTQVQEESDDDSGEELNTYSDDIAGFSVKVPVWSEGKKYGADCAVTKGSADPANAISSLFVVSPHMSDKDPELDAAYQIESPKEYVNYLFTTKFDKTLDKICCYHVLTGDFQCEEETVSDMDAVAFTGTAIVTFPTGNAPINIAGYCVFMSDSRPVLLYAADLSPEQSDFKENRLLVEQIAKTFKAKVPTNSEVGKE